MVAMALSSVLRGEAHEVGLGRRVISICSGWNMRWKKLWRATDSKPLPV
jgi:hypothetical protein